MLHSRHFLVPNREALAETLIKKLAHLDYLEFCPSEPDKCGGCELNPEALTLVKDAFDALTGGTREGES